MTPAELKSEADRARRNGRLDAAEDLLQQAVAMLRAEGGDPLALAHTIRHLGDLYRHMGNVQQAMRCCTEGLDLYRCSADVASSLDVANAVRSMALVREMSNDRETARALWEEARTLYDSCGVESGVAESTRHLASLGEGE
jgi:tetratricopeptide (TPR) repeat protein